MWSFLHLLRNWLVLMVLTNLWTHLLKLIDFEQILLRLSDLHHVFVSILLDCHMSHCHCFCRCSGSLFWFHELCIYFYLCVSVQLVVLSNVSVCSTYHCSYGSRWFIRHSKGVSTLWIEWHLHLERRFPIVKGICWCLVWDDYHFLGWLSESIRITCCSYSVLAGKFV